MLRERLEGEQRMWIAGVAFATLLALAVPPAFGQSAGTMNRIRDAGKVMLGYETDARPFSFRDDAGKPAGYSVDLCTKVADELKTALAIGSLAVEWVPVALDDRFRTVQQGKVDLLCGADAATLARRKEVGFSVPIFAGGVGALLRSDSSFRLREVLNKGQQAGPFWRASPGQILEQQTFSAVKGTGGEAWLAGRLDKLQIAATVVPVASYDAGVKRVVDRSSSVLFGDRAILLDAAKRHAPARELTVLERRFSFEPLALVLPRGDDDFRLTVDRALSRLFASDGFRELYAKWFGPPDDYARTFFQTSVLPE